MNLGAALKMARPAAVMLTVAIGMAKLAELTGTGAVTGVGVVVVVDGGETGGAIGVGVG